MVIGKVSRFEKEQKPLHRSHFFQLENKSESYPDLNIGKKFLKGIKDITSLKINLY